MRTYKFALALVLFSATMVSMGAQVEWSSGDMTSAFSSLVGPITSVEASYYVINETAAPSDMVALYQSGDWATSDLITAKEGGGWELNSEYQSYVSDTGSATADAAANFNAVWEQKDDTATYIPSEYVIAVYEAKNAMGGSYAIATIGYHNDGQSNELEPGKEVGSYTNDLGIDAFNYNTGSKWTAVPEPTTVALLALGLAALGLKRKVA